MDTLVTKLRNEVGLTYEQAIHSITCVKEYLQENGPEPDWDAFLCHKAKTFSDSAKEKLDLLTRKAQDITEKMIETMDDWADKTGAKEKIKDARYKAADFISPDENKNK
ncbi:MAG: hypothetical protein FWF54_03030 [Candidatus Azobacteroides sp.]|nr:hypothetical protein [Candidatus Azobacteroides sp.]